MGEEGVGNGRVVGGEGEYNEVGDAHGWGTDMERQMEGECGR